MSTPVDFKPKIEQEPFRSTSLGEPFEKLRDAANENDATTSMRDGALRSQHLPSLLGSLCNSVSTTPYFPGAATVTEEWPLPAQGYYDSGNAGPATPLGDRYNHWGFYEDALGNNNNGWKPIRLNAGGSVLIDFREAAVSGTGYDLRAVPDSEQNVKGILLMFNCQLALINSDQPTSGGLPEPGNTHPKDFVGFTFQYFDASVDRWRPIGFSERFYSRSSGNRLATDTGTTIPMADIFQVEDPVVRTSAGSVVLTTATNGVWGQHYIDVSIRILLTRRVLELGGGPDYPDNTLSGSPMSPQVDLVRPCICVYPYTMYNPGYVGPSWDWTDPNQMRVVIKDLNFTAIALQSDILTSSQ